MIHSRSFLKLFTIAKYLSILILLSSYACKPPPVGTSDQAATARAQYNAGLVKLRALEKEFTALLSQFAQVEVVKTILSEPPTQTSLDIPKQDIAPLFGVYRELATGGFDFTPVADIVTVEYLNGITLKIAALKYHTDMRLQGYALSITSNNRQISTPATDAVTLQIVEVRPDYSQYVPTLLNTGASTIGNYQFVRPGSTTPVAYHITRLQGSVEATGLSLQALQQRRFVENSTVGRPYWDMLETVIYLKSTLPGVWWGFSATHTYRDKTMGLNVHMVASEQTLATTGLASFRPIVQTSGALLNGARVANLSGGAYTCDMNINNDIGSGTSIDLVWLDASVDTIFPSLKFPCARTVLYLPDLL